MSGGSNVNGVLLFHVTMIMLSFTFSMCDYCNSLLNKTMKQEYIVIYVQVRHLSHHSCR